METSEQNTKQSNGSNHIMDSSVSKQSPTDYTYEDDFEELDSFIKEKAKDSSESSPKRSPRSRTSGKKDPDQQGNSGTDTDIHVEKGQRESSGQIPMEKDRVKERTLTFDDLQSDDSEPEAEGDVLFTQDQQRAMMELMAQKHDNGDYAGDPHEYNVKQRLKELNDELAKEPEPDDRQHRVGFKKELVDLVAPAPEVSEDEDDSPNNILQSGPNSAQSKDNTNKQYVVERDGKFDIVEDHELSSSERAMFNIPDDTSGGQTGASNGGKGARTRQEESGKRSGSATVGSKENRQPQPPSKPRPNTANGNSRRSAHVLQSPRPRTASSNPLAIGNYGAILQDFNYSSPYAMSSTEKERALERIRLREQQKKEEERRRREEDEYRRQESEDAFQAWLQQKADDDRKKRQEDEERKRRDSRDDKSDGAEACTQENNTPIFPPLDSLEVDLSMQVKENDEAFRGWLRQKQVQQKREKLLKRREEQGVKESYYVRSREECDMAYKDWLKKKYAEFRQQKAAEKERQKSFMSMARKARKQQMITRAVRHSQAFRFTDVFDYRF